MPAYYKVKQGDHLSGIAKALGFSDYETIWDDPNNADLKAQRVNPNVLYPGDMLYIPDKDPVEYPRPTDLRHKFVRRKPDLKLVLVLTDAYEKPVANASVTLQVGGDKYDLTTDANGKLEQEIKPDAHDGYLIIKDPQTPFQDDTIPIKIGDLDPVDQVSGQQARLNNLGYFAGAVGGNDDAALESAIEEFQCDNNLTVDGKCGPQTQAKLKEVHGC
jgi:hypothetical protein